MKYICIHGHFYQPPRENAWLEYIQKQESAAPFHDWNERINFECYAPNRAARLLDSEGKLIDIINNYEYISFNFGPTLLSWMEKYDALTYEFLQKADKNSAERLEGHGNAMAQVYNHMIMPLASKRDKETQIKWGISDFEYRFGRKPEGMWLAETAVDSETLELMIDNGITFVVLAPRQFKSFVNTEGEEIESEGVDCSKSYKVLLADSKEMTVFFYDGPLSQAIAFEGLLNDGINFARKLMDAAKGISEFGMINIATDGETYGHHHRYGEMALASCIHHINQQEEFQLVNYAWYAAKFKPEAEVKIIEGSSWSCVHGIERWRSDCGCNTGGNAGWNQKWRAPLREALDWLTKSVEPLYNESIFKLVKYPEDARNAYINIILERNDESHRAFMSKWVLPNGVDTEKETKVLRLFELQRNLMLMYTSCGWFFDEVSGIETNQILQYAARAIAYTKTLFGKDLEKEFIGKLELIPSNDSKYKNAANSYRAMVRPGIITLERVAMHVAAEIIFEEDVAHMELFNYEVRSEKIEKVYSNEKILAFGINSVKSNVTLVEEQFAFIVGYFGHHYLSGIILVEVEEKEFHKFSKHLKENFESYSFEEFEEVLSSINNGHSFSLDQLFPEKRRDILNSIVQRNLQDIYESMMTIHKNNYELMNMALHETIPLNAAFVSATQFIMNQNIVNELTNGTEISVENLTIYLSELRKWHLDLDGKENLAFIIGENLFQLLNNCHGEDNENAVNNCLSTTLDLFKWSQEAGLEVNMWKIQNKIYRLVNNEVYGKRIKPNNPLVKELLENFAMERVKKMG